MKPWEILPADKVVTRMPGGYSAWVWYIDLPTRWSHSWEDTDLLAETVLGYVSRFEKDEWRRAVVAHDYPAALFGFSQIATRTHYQRVFALRTWAQAALILQGNEPSDSNDVRLDFVLLAHLTLTDGPVPITLEELVSSVVGALPVTDGEKVAMHDAVSRRLLRYGQRRRYRALRDMLRKGGL